MAAIGKLVLGPLRNHGAEYMPNGHRYDAVHLGGAVALDTGLGCVQGTLQY